MTDAPLPDFRHVVRMTDRHGLFEHAELAEPRPEHGYCTDDTARLLVVAARERDPAPAVSHLAGSSLRFLVEAGSLDGAYRNRMDRSGRWEDEPALSDAWGRSIWAFGTAAARSDAPYVRQLATVQFARATKRRSPHLRSTAFAVLGASEMLDVQPDHAQARLLLSDAADQIPGPAPDPAWPWPEARLEYANAVIPEAMIAAGVHLDRPALVSQGLDLLGWLLDHETGDGHLSVTPAGGADPGTTRPAFDQQPIEVAALADACVRAERVDGDVRWSAGVHAAVAWFLGDNDLGVAMWDPETGGGFDGLTADGPNLNQGAESTLALLSTLQHAHRLAPTSP